MLTDPSNKEKIMSEKLQARFLQLPKALQSAITSADVEKKLRGLSETHKLHLDQWQKLENEVMLALLGFQPVENLEANIKNEVGIAEEEAKALAVDIADTIFEPIREELEKELGGPATEEEKVSDVQKIPINKPTNQPVAKNPESATGSPQPATTEQNVAPITRAQTIIENIPPRPVEVTVVPPAPSTPPAPAPTARSVRATLSPAYAPDSKSHERKTVDDDPYREAIG